jgi:hypothetical protein
MARLPVTAHAWRTGELTGGQIDTITATVNDTTTDTFAAAETELVPTLAGLSTRDTVRALAIWKAHASTDSPPPEPTPGRVHLSRTLDGTGVLDGTLTPEGHALVKTALRVAQSPDLDGEPVRTPAQRRHDALVDLCRWFLDHQHTQSGGRHRPHLNVIVDLDDLHTTRGGHIIDGPTLDGPTIARLGCDSVLHRVLTTGRSSILDYGTSTRTIPVNLWNALLVRDHGCRWPDCDRPSGWCQAHHLVWFTHGGPTALDNLVLLCSRHHHRLHQPGWHAKLKPDATLEITHPHGTTHTSHPPHSLRAMVA